MPKLTVQIIIVIILFIIVMWMFVIGFVEIYRNNKKTRDKEKRSGKK